MPLALPVLSDVDEADIERELRALLAQEEANNASSGRGGGGGGGGGPSSVSSLGIKQHQQQYQQQYRGGGGGGGGVDKDPVGGSSHHPTGTSTRARAMHKGAKSSNNTTLSPLRNPPETPLDVHPSPITVNKVGHWVTGSYYSM